MAALDSEKDAMVYDFMSSFRYAFIQRGYKFAAHVEGRVHAKAAKIDILFRENHELSVEDSEQNQGIVFYKLQQLRFPRAFPEKLAREVAFNQDNYKVTFHRVTEVYFSAFRLGSNNLDFIEQPLSSKELQFLSEVRTFFQSFFPSSLEPS